MTARLYDVLPVRECLNRIGFSEFLHGDDEDIGQQYRRELRAVRSVCGFARFVRRWTGLYALGYQENGNPAELALQKRCNLRRVYAKWGLADSASDSVYYGSGYYYGLAAVVALPTVLLTTFQLSMRYRVPFNVALVQAYNDGGGEFF